MWCLWTVAEATEEMGDVAAREVQVGVVEMEAEVEKAGREGEVVMVVVVEMVEEEVLAVMRALEAIAWLRRQMPACWCLSR